MSYLDKRVLNVGGKGMWLIEMSQLVAILHRHLQICMREMCRLSQHRIEVGPCPQFAPAPGGREGEIVYILEAFPAVEAEVVVVPETVTILASSFIKNDCVP